MGLLTGPVAVNAVPVDTSPITSAYYINFNGLLWAWASPVSSENWFGLNTLYAPSIQDGWREATAGEWASRPLASDFGTSDNFKCASRFWNSSFTYCDYSDVQSGNGTNIRVVNANSLDIWYVKSVPEPVTCWHSSVQFWLRRWPVAGGLLITPSA